MNMNFTPDRIMAAIAIFTFVGTMIITIVGWFLHQKDKNQQLEIKLIQERLQQKDTLQQLESQRLQDSLKASWVVIDRLKEDKGQYWTREEHEKWRAEMRAEVRADMSDLGNRLIREIEIVSKRFSDEFSKLMQNCMQCNK